MRAAWDLASAWHETTPTRERICLNGLWRWQPATPSSDTVPTGEWGWFKVPGCWPGITDYMQADTQTAYRHTGWKDATLGSLTAAWYQRDFTVPPGWIGRRVTLSASYVNSLAIVFVDGKSAGHISFPEGEIDLTSLVKPGEKHTLTMQVVALPLKGVMVSYTDTNAAKELKATVARRGLCGDVYLVGSPAKERVDGLKVETSVQDWSLTARADLSNLDADQSYKLRAIISYNQSAVTTLTSDTFLGGEAKDGKFAFTRPWKPAKLWDIHTPQNQYDLELTLLDGKGKALDVQAPKRFGFRELRINGRDLILNGSRIFWSCVPVDNAAISAQLSTYDGAMESLRRLKSFGINMVYTHNYDCNPGSYLSFEEILRAADDVGMLVALTQPHFGDYDWSAPDAEATNGYARHAAFFVRVAGNHPSVIAYSTSHNATGYNEDMNPDFIDGITDKRDSWAQNNMKKAVRAQAIINRLDPARIVYHHSSGNLGTMHTMNFYLNMVPIQELDDWFEHWSTKGVKPAFMVEYGVPFSWDWAMYRGWYKGVRTFGSAEVPWEYCMAEWNAQFLGDVAYRSSPAEKKNLRWEAQKFETGHGWFRWDYPYPMGSTNPDFEDQQKVWAEYTTDNWRAFRTWGVSGISPWETYSVFWRLKDGVNRSRVELKTDWDALQRPGYSPDYIDHRFERRDTAYEESDWTPTTGGVSLIRNNRPLLAYIGGKPDAFTEKGHDFRAGETVQKQIIVVNNCREPVKGKCSWSLGLPIPETGKATLDVATGDIRMLPLKFALPANLKPGVYKLTAAIEFVNRETQTDSFSINVLPPRPSVAAIAKLAVFDPSGETTKLLASFGVTGTALGAGADLNGYGVLVIGRNAMTPGGPGLDLTRVRDGLKVLVFEQSSDVLEKRFGFRVQEYGLRNVYARVPDSPILAGLGSDRLRDWRGDSTLVPPRRQYELSDKFNGAPAITRSGLLVPRVWRCGNRGDVASVLIEKPAVGDFLSLIDGGFSLEYSPLLEYREGKGLVIFCQMDVTGRTEADPAAAHLAANLLNYVSSWKPSPERALVYAGDSAGRQHLESAGFAVSDFTGVPTAGQVLAVGPRAEAALAGYKEGLAAWMRQGGRALAIGLDQAEIQRSLPGAVTTNTTEYINAVFDPPAAGSPLAGIGPADVYNRDPRQVALVTEGAIPVGGGVLATAQDDHLVFLQLAPWAFATSQQNTKRVFRHTSVTLSRLLGNLGARASTPLLSRFGSPVTDAGEQRWLHGFYLDTPEDSDDPYRFFGW